MSDQNNQVNARGLLGRAKVRQAVAWLITVAVLGGVAGWSIRSLTSPVAKLPEDARYTVVPAKPGSVGQEIRLNVRAQWPVAQTVVSGTSGVITELFVAGGSEISSGDRIMSVGMKPVVVASGAIPVYRALTSGDAGPDVAQLQQMLNKHGYSSGGTTGTFDEGTREGVQKWQTDLGVPATGIVEMGSLVFVSDLPVRVVLASDIKVGAVLGEGRPILNVLPDRPTFTMYVSEGQTDLVAQDQTVLLAHAGQEWSARTGPIEQSMETGDRFTVLRSEDPSQNICGNSCKTVPVTGLTLVPGRVQIVPEVKGIVIPASAVTTTADGQQAVVSPEGELRGVRVVAGAFGTVVVEGISEGDQVRAPGLVPNDTGGAGGP